MIVFRSDSAGSLQIVSPEGINFKTSSLKVLFLFGMRE